MALEVALVVELGLEEELVAVGCRWSSLCWCGTVWRQMGRLCCICCWLPLQVQVRSAMCIVIDQRREGMCYVTPGVWFLSGHKTAVISVLSSSQHYDMVARKLVCGLCCCVCVSM